MKRLLWVGDAACGSGFGRATHHILERLRHTWDIKVIGINYRGDPHTEPYDIYPAYIDGDLLGAGRLKALVPQLRPDLVVVQTNPWNVPTYMKHLDGVPTMGVIAVEGKNCVGRHLNKLQKAIFWTEFGRREAVRGGMTIPSAVIPLGVDAQMFSPGDRVEARRLLGLPERCLDAFIVTNVNRNQNRKRLDLTVQFFAEWWHKAGRPNAYLHLHVLPGSSTRVDCSQLAQYYGLEDLAHGTTRLILAEPDDQFMGAPDKYVVATYRASDVGLSTSLGEGWGLTTMEGAACGRPQIAGDFAAVAEWGADGIYLVPVLQEGVMPDVHGQIGAEPSGEAVVNALDVLYRDVDQCERWGMAALHVARRSEFTWSSICDRYVEELGG